MDDDELREKYYDSMMDAVHKKIVECAAQKLFDEIIAEELQELKKELKDTDWDKELKTLINEADSDWRKKSIE